MRVASLFLLLALAHLSLATIGGNHWFVWTQNTDTNGEWGYLNFYPQSLSVNPGDYITFIQNHDTGIIATVSKPGPPSQFYPPPAGAPPGAPAGPCADGEPLAPCVALTPLAMPYTGGPQGNFLLSLTHINTTTGVYEYSSGFLAAAEEELPSVWTFYIDLAIPVSTVITFYEVLHVMKLPVTITGDDQALINITPATSNATAAKAMMNDANTASNLFEKLVTPINGAQYNTTSNAWIVHLGVQSEGDAEGYGVGSFDRFIPFSTNGRKSVIEINQGDTIEFLQITPHAHAVSIFKPSQPFPQNNISVSFEYHTLTEPLTHFVPQPAIVNGVQTFSDATPYAVTGPFLLPGNRAMVKFDVSPGTYYYFCVFHEAVNMEGEIVVKEKGTIPTPGGAGFLSASIFLVAAVVMMLSQL